MSDADWQDEIDRMFRHSRLTQQFIEGKISPSNYEDGLADLQLDPYTLEEFWDEGNSLLYL